MLAYAPHYPVPRQEYWYFILADPAVNGVLGWARVSLMEAEALTAAAAAPSQQKAEPQKSEKAIAKEAVLAAKQQSDAADSEPQVYNCLHLRMRPPTSP